MKTGVRTEGAPTFAVGRMWRPARLGRLWRPSKGDGAVNASRRVLVVALLAGCGLLSGCGPVQSTVAPTSTETATPTQSPAVSATPTQSPAVSATPASTPTALPSFVGEWERHGKQDGKPYTEHFALNPDGTYSIEARFDNPDAPLASSHGTYESTDTTLTLTDQGCQDHERTLLPGLVGEAGNRQQAGVRLDKSAIGMEEGLACGWANVAEAHDPSGH